MNKSDVGLVILFWLTGLTLGATLQAAFGPGYRKNQVEVYIRLKEAKEEVVMDHNGTVWVWEPVTGTSFKLDSSDQKRILHPQKEQYAR